MVGIINRVDIGNRDSDTPELVVIIKIRLRSYPRRKQGSKRILKIQTKSEKKFKEHSQGEII